MIRPKILFIACCILGISCQSKNELTSDKIQMELDRLRANYKEERLMLCKKEMLSQIELEADSILIVLSKRIKYDSLTIPYDSIRPENPQIQFPEYRKPEKPKTDSIK